MNGFDEAGYAVFAPEPALRAWAEAAWDDTQAMLASGRQDAQWTCEGTWFVGVDVLSNAPGGEVAGLPLEGAAVDMARSAFDPAALHHAQVSILRPGYPRPRDGESAGAFRYRQRRDAAHVDGLLPIGAARRRCLREPHAWILGIALSQADAEASPLVVWPGSHRIMRAAFRRALADIPVARWAEVDLTAPYQDARARIFETGARRTVPIEPGGAVLLHRHLLHGIAPWSDGAVADPLGRAVAYFRPQFGADWSPWLSG